MKILLFAARKSVNRVDTERRSEKEAAMKEILQKAETIMEKMQADVAYLEQVLELLEIKGKSHQDKSEDQRVS